MCVKDVQLGQKKIGRLIMAGPPSARTNGNVATRNPNRATLVIALQDVNLAVPAHSLLVCVNSLGGPTVGVLTDHTPVVVTTVEVFGEGCTGAVFIQDVGGTDPNLSVTEFVWNEPVENI